MIREKFEAWWLNWVELHNEGGSGGPILCPTASDAYIAATLAADAKIAALEAELAEGREHVRLLYRCIKGTAKVYSEEVDDALAWAKSNARGDPSPERTEAMTPEESIILLTIGGRDCRLIATAHEVKDELLAALRSAGFRIVQDWRTIDSAKKDGNPILAKFKNPIPREGRPDLERWGGIQCVLNHRGLAEDGFDIGWQMAAPVGQGGFPDDWIEGWMPVPALDDPAQGQTR